MHKGLLRWSLNGEWKWMVIRDLRGHRMTTNLFLSARPAAGAPGARGGHNLFALPPFSTLWFGSSSISLDPKFEAVRSCCCVLEPQETPIETFLYRYMEHSGRVSSPVSAEPTNPILSVGPHSSLTSPLLHVHFHLSTPPPTAYNIGDLRELCSRAEFSVPSIINIT
jgi:hypothetical protein